MKISTVFALLFFGCMALFSDVSTAFSQVDKNATNLKNYQFMTFPVLVDKNLVRSADAKTLAAVKDYNETGDGHEAGVIVHYLFDVKLKPADKDYFRFMCNETYTKNYSCSLVKMNCAWDKDASCHANLDLRGTTFQIPGDGCIYHSGHTSNLFDEHHKSCLIDGKMQETKQPFLVGSIVSKAQQALVLYGDQSLKKPVAQIAKGDPVELVLKDEESDLFLLRDRFGIAGWSQLKTVYTPAEAAIEGVYHAGD